MEVAINEHITLFVRSIIAGILLGACYDVVMLCRSFFGLGIDFCDSPRLAAVELPVIGRRKRHNAGKTSRAARCAILFIIDFLFMIFASVYAVVFLYAASNGTPRLFALAGGAFGFAAYIKTAGRLTRALASYIFFAVDAALRYAVWITVTPLKAAGRAAARVLALVYRATLGRIAEKRRRYRSEKRQKIYFERGLTAVFEALSSAVAEDGTQGVGVRTR